MAVASAAVNLGSLVKEVAICSTKNCWIDDFWTLSTNLGWTKSSVEIGAGVHRLLGEGETDDAGTKPIGASLCFELSDISA